MTRPIKAVAPAPHSAPHSGSTNSAFGAVPSKQRMARLNGFDLYCIAYAVFCLSLFGAIVVSWMGQS